MMFILHNNWLLVQKGEVYGQNSCFFSISDLETLSFLGNRTILEKKRCVLLFSVKRQFEWCMMIKEKFQNQGGDRFARGESYYIECLLVSKSWDGDFLFLRLKSTWLDSVFDAESEYIKFRKLKSVEEVEILSLLIIMQSFRFFHALRILRISPRKVARIWIRRCYSESAQSEVSKYVAFDRK